MKDLHKQLAALALLAAMQPHADAAGTTGRATAADTGACIGGVNCATDLPWSWRATTLDGSVLRLSAADTRRLSVPAETYLGRDVQLRTDIGREPQPLRVPVGTVDGTVVTETVHFEYAGVQLGPQAIEVRGGRRTRARVSSESLVGDLFVAVPHVDDDWSSSNTLKYDPRYGRAAGYILRYNRGGTSHSSGSLIVASGADTVRQAIDIGSVGDYWSGQLGLNPKESAGMLHYTIGTPSSQGFHENGCGGLAICDNFCSAAVPWEVEECGSACCSSGGGGGSPVVNQCTDGIDNDGDGAADGNDTDCNHSAEFQDGDPHHVHRYESGFNFMLTAKAGWCSGVNDPFGKLWARAGYTKQAFRAGTGNAAFDAWKLDNDNVARPVAVKCWIFDDPAAADACDANGDCHPFGAGSAHPYPFAQKSLSTALYAAAEHDLRHSADVGLAEPVSLIQVIAETFEPASGGAAAGAADQPGRASVVMSSAPNSTSAHEFGHSVGLDHCNAEQVDGQWTLMSSALEDACPGMGSHQANHLGPINGGALHQCLLGSCVAAPSFGNP